MKCNPLISIIIPTLNEERYIERALGLLRRQSYRNFEIVVADGGSIDNTVKKAMENTKVVISDRPGVAHQINIGFKHTQGDIIAFLNADVIAPSGYLKSVTWEFEKDRGLIAVTGPLVVPADSPLWIKVEYHVWNVIRFIYSLLPKPFGMFFATAVTTAVRRRAFKEIGGFDESLLVNEDGDLGKRLMSIGTVKFSWNLYQVVIPRRAKSAFSFNTYYLYILGNMFPFGLLPNRIWKVLRLRSSIEFLRGAKERATTRNRPVSALGGKR